MAVPDNRIRFPTARIDFENDVGLTGQNHDDYPAAGGQARYDWMRMVIIGLLSGQASTEEPTEYRQGTRWFDLNTNTLKIRSGDDWVPFADTIALTAPDTNGDVVTLSAWYTVAQELLVGLAPEIVFSGQCNTDDVTTIEVPTTLQASLMPDSRVFLYLNGLLIKPTNCALVGSPTPTTIRLSGLSLSTADSYTVIIRRVPAATFYEPNVVVP